jgi:hypothetical protein
VITRLVGERSRLAVLRQIDRPAVVGLAVAQAIIAAAGWFASPVWLAAAVAAQLAVGGVGAIRIFGPARAELGLARYAMPAAAGICATVFGRLIPGGISLLLIPIVAVLLWSVTYLELRVERGTGGRTIGVLLRTTMAFAGAAGILSLFGILTWPTPLILVAGLTLPLALRDAEARGSTGAEGFGQALLHLLVVTQVGAAAALLLLSPVVVSALLSLAFYTWGGAVDALRGEATGRSVAAEFGALTILGLVLGLVLARV